MERIQEYSIPYFPLIVKIYIYVERKVACIIVLKDAHV